MLIFAVHQDTVVMIYPFGVVFPKSLVQNDFSGGRVSKSKWKIEYVYSNSRLFIFVFLFTCLCPYG